MSDGRPAALDVYESPAPTLSGQPCNTTQPAAFRPLLVST